jgi:hypothetical protein
MMARQTPQLVINERHQRIEGGLIATTPVEE